MSELPERNAASRYGWLLFLLPVLYVLSTGPAVYLYTKAGHPKAMEGFLEAFYWPVEWMYDHSQIFQGLLERYLELFH